MIHLRGEVSGVRADVARRSAIGALAGLIGAIAVISLAALGQQNPCAEQGPDCRPLKPAEIAALKERLLALRAILPVPEPARWAVPSDAGDAFMAPFIAELNAGGAMVSGSWPAGAFTELNQIDIVYDGLKKSETKPKEAEDPLAAVAQMQAAIGNRIEILAKLLPHAYLVEEVDGKCVDVSDPEATNVQRTATFLSWETSEGTILTVVFGPRTCNPVEVDRVDKPAPALAPVKCVTLEISGPTREEIAALKKKIDRKAFEALLGPLTK
jgi:hypothetical protein